MKIKCTNKDIEKQISACNCVLSDVTKQSIRMSILDLLGDAPIDRDEIDYSIDISNYRPGHLTATICFRDEKCYDWMMDQCETSIDARDVNCIKSKRMIFVSHNNVELYLKVFIYAKLKQEDFDTLDMLGKVHRSLDKPTIQTSIYCEI